MKGTLMLAVIVFLLLAAAYLYLTDHEDAWSKAYHMLLLKLMKLDLALAEGMDYIRLSLRLIFRGYHYPEAAGSHLEGKRARIAELRKQMEASGEGHRRREQYRRKILV